MQDGWKEEREKRRNENGASLTAIRSNEERMEGMQNGGRKE